MTKFEVNFIIDVMGDRKENQPGIISNSQSNPANEKSFPELSLKEAIKYLPLGIVFFDLEMKILEANPHAAEIINLSEYIDKSLALGTDEKIWQNWTEILKRCISRGKTQKFDEVEYTLHDQKKHLNLTCTCFQSVKKTGNHVGILLIEDITAKTVFPNKSHELERLAAVGKHASRVAHELNNPLDGILRYINLTIRAIEHENLEKPKEYLEQCRQGLMRMIRIIKDLLEFSRCTYAPLESLPIEQIIEDALKTLNLKAEALNVQILRDYHPGLPKIKSGSLFQVFCNLTKNALDAMPDGGEIKISTYPAEDDTIVVEFRDTGTGLPTENTEVIFEPFFTTKEDKGTGLGLAICRDIIKSRYGRITARNAPEGGSIFTVNLPTSDDSR
ncbi:MAG: hypothetical protein JW715_05380 [Sedimentisphaerales bacterium]|nr:hypothetical protein [Sedimentisphaerales bacterium]